MKPLRLSGAEKVGRADHGGGDHQDRAAPGIGTFFSPAGIQESKLLKMKRTPFEPTVFWYFGNLIQCAGF
jgi:hypothetical protein